MTAGNSLAVFCSLKNTLAPNSPQKFFKVILFYPKIKTKKPVKSGFLFG
nr:MAG TPA: hypothetical protein [Caudoviricetes sp.]